MLRRPILALALLSTLTGCIAAPPNGPLVEYREGLTPITRPAPCAAKYVLVPTGGFVWTAPLAEQHVAKGQRIGFRREEDGSVTAVAPEYTLPLAPGAYAWEVVRSSVPPWRERVKNYARMEVKETVETTQRVLFLTAIGVVVLGFVALYAYAESNTPGARR